ncbi:hypothetical protein [Cohnella terricola]|uniref:Uncharacterized protein n=1 Tax=Cohnella terricola TaxID=1289167 RepID=A0A559JL76_9BACL|nr:hypothetical protein [Cohnella terricola]TVY00620.1 hypothetical protein FPZ45_11450 [Cohnella terricola]
MNEQLEGAVAVAQPAIKPEPKTLAIRILVIVALILAITSCGAAAILYVKSNELAETNDAQGALIAEQAKKIEGLSAKISKYDKQISEISAIKNLAKNHTTTLNLMAMQHLIEGGVVTDDFTVEKLHLISEDNEKLLVNIDIGMQPSMKALYVGRGTFNLSDRELRAKSQTLIAAVKELYGPSESYLPKWDDNNVYVTIKNYEIGDTTSGTFKLAGEK